MEAGQMGNDRWVGREMVRMDKMGNECVPR